MSNYTLTAAVLSAIKNAPESISIQEISWRAGVSTRLATEIVEGLVEAGYLKENAANAGTYFTRRPKRADIDAFLTTACSEMMPTQLPGLEITINRTDRSTQARLAVLGFLLVQPEASRINPDDFAIPSELIYAAIDVLAQTNVIKEHSQKPGHYFTAVDYRPLCRTFVESAIWPADMSVAPPEVPAPSPFADEPTVADCECGFDDQQSNQEKAILAKTLLNILLNAEHATPFDTFGPEYGPVIDELIGARVIKSNDDGIFTRKQYRDQCKVYAKCINLTGNHYLTLLSHDVPTSNDPVSVIMATEDSPEGRESRLIQLIKDMADVLGRMAAELD